MKKFWCVWFVLAALAGGNSPLSAQSFGTYQGRLRKMSWTASSNPGAILSFAHNYQSTVMVYYYENQMALVLKTKSGEDKLFTIENPRRDPNAPHTLYVGEMAADGNYGEMGFFGITNSQVIFSSFVISVDDPSYWNDFITDKNAPLSNNPDYPGFSQAGTFILIIEVNRLSKQ